MGDAVAVVGIKGGNILYRGSNTPNNCRNRIYQVPVLDFCTRIDHTFATG